MKKTSEKLSFIITKTSHLARMKIFRYFFVPISIIFAALILALFWVDRDIYNEYISSRISYISTENGIPLTLTKPRFYLTGIKAQNVSCSIPAGKTFIMLQPNDLKLDTTLNTLLGKGLSATLTSKFYEGELSGSVKKFSDDNFGAMLKITDMDIKQHPQLAPFGISAGKLGLELNDFHFSKERPKSGKLKVALQGLEIPKELSLESYGIPLTIPVISDLSFDTELTLSTLEDGQPNLVVNSLVLQSSLLELNLDGDLKFFNNNLNNLRITGNVKLSDDLRKLVNPQLILAAVQASGHHVKSTLTKDSNEFTINIVGLWKKLRIECKEKGTSIDSSASARKIKRAKLKR